VAALVLLAYLLRCLQLRHSTVRSAGERRFADLYSSGSCWRLSCIAGSGGDRGGGRLRSMFLKRFSTFRVCRIRSLIRSQASVISASLRGGGGCAGLGLLPLISRRICPETRFDLASGNGAILCGNCQGNCG
jgi:hypothetical protein